MATNIRYVIFFYLLLSFLSSGAYFVGHQFESHRRCSSVSHHPPTARWAIYFLHHACKYTFCCCQLSALYGTQIEVTIDSSGGLGTFCGWHSFGVWLCGTVSAFKYRSELRSVFRGKCVFTSSADLRSIFMCVWHGKVFFLLFLILVVMVVVVLRCRHRDQVHDVMKVYEWDSIGNRLLMIPGLRFRTVITNHPCASDRQACKHICSVVVC